MAERFGYCLLSLRRAARDGLSIEGSSRKSVAAAARVCPRCTSGTATACKLGRPSFRLSAHPPNVELWTSRVSLSLTDAGHSSDGALNPSRREVLGDSSLTCGRGVRRTDSNSRTVPRRQAGHGSRGPQPLRRSNVGRLAIRYAPRARRHAGVLDIAAHVGGIAPGTASASSLVRPPKRRGGGTPHIARTIGESRLSPMPFS